MAEKVVIKKSEFIGGAPMESRQGVRDWKVIYPETGFSPKTLITGIVEIPPGNHSPLHKHACEECYYVLAGKGEIESDGVRYPFEEGDAILNKEGVAHRVWCTGDAPVRLLVTAGIMLIGLLPKWPTEGPYEILER